MSKTYHSILCSHCFVSGVIEKLTTNSNISRYFVWDDLIIQTAFTGHGSNLNLAFVQ
jgi:hypothetical protein